jgi:hypothetical protein
MSMRGHPANRFGMPTCAEWNGTWGTAKRPSTPQRCDVSRLSIKPSRTLKGGCGTTKPGQAMNAPNVARNCRCWPQRPRRIFCRTTRFSQTRVSSAADSRLADSNSGRVKEGCSGRTSRPLMVNSVLGVPAECFEISRHATSSKDHWDSVRFLPPPGS